MADRFVRCADWRRQRGLCSKACARLLSARQKLLVAGWLLVAAGAVRCWRMGAPWHMPMFYRTMPPLRRRRLIRRRWHAWQPIRWPGGTGSELIYLWCRNGRRGGMNHASTSRHVRGSYGGSTARILSLLGYLFRPWSVHSWLRIANRARRSSGFPRFPLAAIPIYFLTVFAYGFDSGDLAARIPLSARLFRPPVPTHAGPLADHLERRGDRSRFIVAVYLRPWLQIIGSEVPPGGRSQPSRQHWRGCKHSSGFPSACVVA